MSGKIDVDRLSLEVMKTLDVYRDVTIDIMKEAVERTAEETVTEIRKNIESSGIEDTGSPSYAKSWAKKRDNSLAGRYRYDMVVYSKAPKYRLAHLLEEGHASRNGGRVKAYPHVQPAADFAADRLIQHIKDGIERGG